MGERQRVAIVKEIAKEMPMSQLLVQYEKTADDRIKEEVSQIIQERRTCPDCGGEMLEDQKTQELYCPMGHNSICL